MKAMFKKIKQLSLSMIIIALFFRFKIIKGEEEDPEYPNHYVSF